MKKLPVLLATVLVLQLTACGSLFHSKSANDTANQHVVSGPVYTPYSPPSSGGPVIVVGESSNTVERLGQQHGCTTNQGASLLTSDGPVETYRMVCTDGRVFSARCEFRQCVQMQQ